MKAKNLKIVIAFILVTIASCDEPDTVVTDIVHQNGSVTRKIEMRNKVNKFKTIQVPFDSTWLVRDTLEINEKGDTTWIKKAEKFFDSIDGINKSYLADTGANRDFSRRVEFRKRFQWFNTEYRFAEIIDKVALYGYPVSDFLDSEELNWFYAPDFMKKIRQESADSLRYKVLDDSVGKKTDRWFIKSFASEWINEFAGLLHGKGGKELSLESLKLRENDLIRISNVDKFDSLWSAGVLLREFIGEPDALKYRSEADTAMETVTKRIFNGLSSYSQKIDMPGKVIGTNGFRDSTGNLMWPVKSDFNMTQNYEMWAESKTPNQWAWIVTGLFILFVISGFIFRKMKRG